MSSVGGSRGERNAKPKFSALDINSLYRTSRGESLEPSQQKNTVPRKHGMQSLGKVPSARRPPANLPSLKAETSTPTESSTTANDSTTSITSASSTPPQQQQQNNSSNNFSVQNNSNNNNQQQAGGHQHHHQNQQQSLNSGNSSDRNSNNSTTWSSVTTGGTQPQEGQPPLYQSPQFQHEFPSLDGTTPSGSKVSHQAQTNAVGTTTANNQQQQQQTSANHQNSSAQQQQYDGPQMSLRPQTEPSTWMQQNMSGKGVGGDANQLNSQQGPVLQVPPQLKALMPSFMYRSGGGSTGGSTTGSSTGGGFGGLSSSNNTSTSSPQLSNNNNNNQNNNYRLRNFGNNNNNNDHPTYQGRRSGNIPPRLQNQQQQQQQPRSYDDYSGRGPPPPLIEPEAIIHRPIIRDEELERIENIAKDDGWAKDDTIDYNQKLNFSDDEVDPPPAASVTKDRKHEKDDIKKSDEEKRLSWNREKDRHDYDRHESRYEKDSRYSQNGVDRRPGALDNEILERVKQRREEEEKREMERRQAAAKKLQALEEKIHSKRANVSEDSDNATTASSVTQGGKLDGKETRHVYERRERYDKYERGGSGVERGGDPRDRNFQSNLPPRFQRQQHGGPQVNERSQNDRFERNYRGERASGATTQKESNSTTTTPSTADTKNVPFAQQYDPRYIHQNMSKQLLQQKRRSDELLLSNRRSNENRGRLDSDREDFFMSRKISVSSDDKPTSAASHIEKSNSRERITSWVDELEANEHDSKGSDIYTEKQKQLMKSIDPGSDYEPKHILQRSKTSVSDDSSSNLNKSITHDDKMMSDEKTTTTAEKRSSESPKSGDHATNDVSGEKSEDLKKDESHDDKKRVIEKSDHQKSSYKEDDRRHDKRGTRGGRDTGGRRFDTRDSRGGRRGGYDSYRGSSGSWNRRGGRGGYYRHGNMDYYSESEGSDYDDDYDRKDSRKGGKDVGKGQNRETFAPRGEPSRRGRGGSSGMSYNRRGGGQMHGGVSGNKRIDNYGPPSSKSPFTGSDDQKEEFDRERKVSEHSDDKSKKQQQHLKSSSHKGSDSHKDRSIKPSDEEKGADEHKTKSSNDERKEKGDSESQDAHGHRKIFGGGKREDGDRSYSSQYNRGSSSQQSTRSGKPQAKDDRAKPLSKPPGLSGKPRMKTNSTSSVGSNSERENSRPQPQRSSSNKDINLQRGVNKSQTGSGTTTNKTASNHWDAKKVNIGSETQHSTEKSHDEGVQQQQQQQPTGVTQPASDTVNISKTETAKQVLDGTTPPVNTIIFENTNYKTNPVVSSVSTQSTTAVSSATMKRSVPGSQGGISSNTQKLHQSQDDVFKSASTPTTTINEMMEQQRVQQVAAAMQQSQEQALNSALQSIDFNKADAEYDKDMKFNFTFGSDLASQISSSNDDKSGKQAKSLQHGVTTVQSNIISGSTVDLNMKIASVKKVWDVMPTVMEHSNSDAAVESAAAQIASNVASFQHQHQHQLHQFAQAHANMSHVQHALSSSNNYSNFGHDQSTLESHFSGSKTSAGDQGLGNDENSYISSNASSQHAGSQQGHNQNIKHVSEVLGSSAANICKVKPSQQQLQQASGLGLSPPPQMQGTIPTAPQSYYQASQAYGMSAIPSPPAAVVFNQAASQAGMYNPFQIEAGRSQFSQYPTHYSATGNAPYANYMQTPPTMPTAPAHAEMYQNAFRTMGGAVQTPFNQSQQMNNPSTVLISSTSNTLMSTSVKPPSQIGAIGSKSAQPYGAQQYMGVYPQQAPLQNNNFYSNSAGQQANAAFFGTAATGTIQNYAGIFGGHGTPTPSNAPQAQFGSQYPQQYRGPNTNATQQGSAYMKQGGVGQGQNNAGQSQGGPQSMQDSSIQSSKSSSNNGTPDVHSSAGVQATQSSPSQHLKNFSGGNWDMQNQIFQQQLINATLFQQQQQQQQQYQQQTVPPCYPSPIQRPNNNFDRMNMQMSGQQQYYSSNRGQPSQTTSSKKDETKN